MCFGGLVEVRVEGALGESRARHHAAEVVEEWVGVGEIKFGTDNVQRMRVAAHVTSVGQQIDEWTTGCGVYSRSIVHEGQQIVHSDIEVVEEDSSQKLTESRRVQAPF